MNTNNQAQNRKVKVKQYPKSLGYKRSVDVIFYALSLLRS